MYKLYYILATTREPKTGLLAESKLGPVSSRKAADAAFLITLKKRNVVACEILEEK